ncbi:MAG: PHP domain-containing protein, partial [Acidobacteriota bacterium]|nr:PHP domain-containing protein [Acidobacteriota bacterium]
MTEQYVELHAASAFSFLQAASQPESLIERAVEIEMPAMALLDYNGVYGAARFHTTAQRNSVRAHVGAEISVSSFGPRLTPPAWLPHQHQSEPARLPLLCESREGYQNLCQLITQFKMRDANKKDGAATFDDLSEYASGLVCLTGGDEGPLAAALARGGEAAGRETVERLTRIFGNGHVYIELQRHQERAEEWRNQAAIRIARSLNVPVIATNGV